MAPEVLNKSVRISNLKKIDIYAIGIMLYYCIYKKSEPLNTTKLCYSVIKSLNNLIQKCRDKLPQNRPTAEEVKQELLEIQNSM